MPVPPSKYRAPRRLPNWHDVVVSLVEENRAEILSRQFTGANNAKLVVTFFTGVAAAVVIPAIQAPGDHTGEAINIARWLFAAAFAFAVATFLLDGLEEFDYVTLDKRRRDEQWDERTTAREAAAHRYSVIRRNGRWELGMRVAARFQVLAAVIACVYVLWWLY